VRIAARERCGVDGELEPRIAPAENVNLPINDRRRRRPLEGDDIGNRPYTRVGMREAQRTLRDDTMRIPAKADSD
jgi:hypothetical protein